MPKSLQTYPSLRNDPALAAYWPLDGNSNDSAGANNGSDTAITYNPASGLFGQGALFNGSNSVITAGTGLAPTGAITIGGWMKISTWPLAGAAPCLIGKTTVNSPFGGYQIFAYLNGATQALAAGLNVGGVWNSPNSPIARLLNTWYFCVLTYDGTTIRFYVNAIEDLSQQAVTSGTIGYQSTTATVTIGKNAASADFVNGAIEDVFVFNRALTENEIATLYALGLPNYPPYIRVGDGMGRSERAT